MLQVAQDSIQFGLVTANVVDDDICAWTWCIGSECLHSFVSLCHHAEGRLPERLASRKRGGMYVLK
jgi:hypothetical protein